MGRGEAQRPRTQRPTQQHCVCVCVCGSQALESCRPAALAAARRGASVDFTHTTALNFNMQNHESTRLGEAACKEMRLR